MIATGKSPSYRALIPLCNKILAIYKEDEDAIDDPEFEFLLKDSAWKRNVHIDDGMTPLGLACYFNLPKAIHKLIQAGANLEQIWSKHLSYLTVNKH